MLQSHQANLYEFLYKKIYKKFLFYHCAYDDVETCLFILFSLILAFLAYTCANWNSNVSIANAVTLTWDDTMRLFPVSYRETYLLFFNQIFTYEIVNGISLQMYNCARVIFFFDLNTRLFILLKKLTVPPSAFFLQNSSLH